MAVDRTVMAADRSLMAWVRTGLSLNGFGFTLYKFMQATLHPGSESSAKIIGLFVIRLGILSILLGCLDYWRVSHLIKSSYGISMQRFPLAIASLVGGLGSILFIIVIFKLA